MKHNNDFKLDYHFGLISEKYYGKVVSDIANGLTECKAERDQWVETGNTFVEFKSRGKPSGIATTHADHWVVSFYKGKEVCFTLTVPIESMKKIARKGRLIRGGDENTSEGMLVSIQDLINPDNYGGGND